MKAFPHKGKMTINETVCGTGMMSAGQRTIETNEPGMDLRDYFAAKAMQGMCTGATAHDVFLARDLIADAANEMADAMMKAREQ